MPERAPAVPPLDAGDRSLIALNAVAGVAAVGGAWYALGGAPGWAREWLDGSPFSDYRIPGLLLGGVYAPASLATAAALWRRAPRAGEAALVTGAIQVVWIATQYRIIGLRSFLQPTMGAVGLADIGLAWRKLRRQGSR